MRVQPFTPRRPRVELIPLIDMFFLLLVFFIFGVFSMTTQEGIRVELPQAATAAASKDETLTVSLTAEGTLFVDQDLTTLETLAVTLQARHGGNPDTTIIINADRAVTHGAVISVLDTIRQAGFKRLIFQTAPGGV